MAKLTSNHKVEVTIGMELTEQEALALYTIATYRSDHILAALYKVLGEHSELKENEAGFLSFCETLRKQMHPILKKAKEARSAFYGVERDA